MEQELLGWNPAEEPPSINDHSRVSVYEQLTRALVLWHHTHELGIQIGFILPQLLQHLLSVYPYKGPGDLSPQDYADQVRFVTTLVFVLTNHGRLRCETVRNLNMFGKRTIVTRSCTRQTGSASSRVPLLASPCCISPCTTRCGSACGDFTGERKADDVASVPC